MYSSHAPTCCLPVLLAQTTLPMCWRNKRNARGAHFWAAFHSLKTTPASNDTTASLQALPADGTHQDSGCSPGNYAVPSEQHMLQCWLLVCAAPGQSIGGTSVCGLCCLTQSRTAHYSTPGDTRSPPRPAAAAIVRTDGATQTSWETRICVCILAKAGKNEYKQTLAGTEWKQSQHVCSQAASRAVN